MNFNVFWKVLDRMIEIEKPRIETMRSAMMQIWQNYVVRAHLNAVMEPTLGKFSTSYLVVFLLRAAAVNHYFKSMVFYM